MEELWLAISTRYQDNPVVAAYDIMNEPEAQSDSGNGMMDDPRNQVYASDTLKTIDVNHDPYWLIKLKWGACLNTKYFERVLF